jgi:hypothetical protein
MSSRMIGLSDSQLGIIMSAAEPLVDEKCQEFLERVAEAVASVLQVRGQINDDDVSVAVQLGLRALLNNSAVWKEWNRNSLATRQSEQGFDEPLAGPRPVLKTWRALPWSTKLPLFTTGLGLLGLLGWRWRKKTV